jgi:hypothetical protein
MQTRRISINHYPTLVEKVMNSENQPKIARYNTMFIKTSYKK